MKKYETSPHIKKELVELLFWDRRKMFSLNATDDELRNKLENRVEEYLTEKDIALYGEMRKLHGANTRNATLELWVMIGAMVVGLGFSILLCYFF